jgi:hypothetical protein
VSTLPEILDGLATALVPIATEIPDLQVYAGWLPQPSPPSLEIFPADPFQDGEGFSKEKKLFFTVRARASMLDTDSGQRILLQLLEPDGPTSVESALCWDGLGGLVDSVAVAEGFPSGYREYTDGDTGRLLGCEWRVEVLT